MNKLYKEYQEEITFSLTSILPFAFFLVLDYFLKFEAVIWGAFTFGLSVILYLLSTFVFEREITSGLCKLLVLFTGCFFAFSLAIHFNQ